MANGELGKHSSRYRHFPDLIPGTAFLRVFDSFTGHVVNDGHDQSTQAIVFFYKFDSSKKFH